MRLVFYADVIVRNSQLLTRVLFAKVGIFILQKTACVIILSAAGEVLAHDAQKAVE